jgi:hypothetical protein
VISVTLGRGPDVDPKLLADAPEINASPNNMVRRSLSLTFTDLAEAE